MFNSGEIINIFQRYQEWALIISIIISIIVSLIGVLPSIFITGANIIFFGPIIGFFISLLGETIGGYITFKVYRLGIKHNVESIKGKFLLLDNLMLSNGKKTALLLLEGRLLPFIPSGFVTLAASISNVNSGTFILTTLIGKIPSIALEVLISYDFINVKENYIRLVITIITVILIVFTLKRKTN